MTDQHADFGPDEDSKTSPKATSNAELRVRIARAIHRYDNHHALSGNDMPSRHHRGEAEAVLAELKPELDALAALREVARGYCPACGRGDAAPTVEDWERERKRAETAEDFARRALAQRQEMAAERHAWQERGDRAEAALERVRALHRKASHGETCVYCAHGQRLGYDTTWPCDTIRALAEPAPGPDTTSPAAGPTGWIRNGARGSRIPHITAHPVTPEMERASTERAIQAAADNERAREWIAAHSGRTAAEEQRDQLAALAREILYATHNISSQDWARWRETLDTITDQEQP